jgi:hypothetical protein
MSVIPDLHWSVETAEGDVTAARVLDVIAPQQTGFV